VNIRSRNSLKKNRLPQDRFQACSRSWPALYQPRKSSTVRLAPRLAEAALLRAVGESQGIKVRAEADRNYVELVSTARRESEIIRGEGDGERNKVFAEAYSKDPEFFAFYRSMQAYSKSLGGGATTLVLDPAWEFLKYFGRGSKDGSPPQQ
jgi:modulator of FtsH protease HflC